MNGPDPLSPSEPPPEPPPEPPADPEPEPPPGRATTPEGKRAEFGRVCHRTARVLEELWREVVGRRDVEHLEPVARADPMAVMAFGDTAPPCVTALRAIGRAAGFDPAAPEPDAEPGPPAAARWDTKRNAVRARVAFALERVGVVVEPEGVAAMTPAEAEAVDGWALDWAAWNDSPGRVGGPEPLPPPGVRAAVERAGGKLRDRWG